MNLFDVFLRCPHHVRMIVRLWLLVELLGRLMIRQKGIGLLPNARSKNLEEEGDYLVSFGLE